MATKVSSLVAVLALGGGILLGACGGGGDDGGSGAKQTFITKGDALCQETTGKVSGLLTMVSEDPGGAVTQALPAFENLSTDLKAIPPPPGDADAAAIVAEYDKILGQLRSIAAAHQAGDVAIEQQLLGQLPSELGAFATRVKAYGFKECGLIGG